MEESEERICSSNNAVSNKHAKKPTIIRASPSPGATNNEEDNSADVKATSVDSEPQPAENSEVVIKRLPPARPSTGPSRQSSVKISARPASIHLHTEPTPQPRPASVHLHTEPTPQPRPASVHLPLSNASSFKDKSSAAKQQKKRPEITVVSARPLSEVAGFSKGVGLPTAAKLPTEPICKPVTAVPNPVPITTPGDVPSSEGSSQPVAAPRRRGSNPDKDTIKSIHPTVEESSVVNGRSVMSGAPPPLPTSRPKGPYIPPPLPSSRPKGAYIPSASAPSASISEGKSSTVNSEPTPVPKPRHQSASDSGKTSHDKVNEKQAVTQNHVAEPRQAGSETHIASLKTDDRSLAATIPDEPHLPPRVSSKPSQKPAVPHPNTAPKPVDAPQHPQSVASTKLSHQTKTSAAKSQAPTLSNNKPSEGLQASKTTMPLMPPSGQKYSRADILSLFDSTYQKNSKSDSRVKVGDSAARSASTGSVGAEQARAKNEADVLHLASAVAQNTTAQDVKNISGGVQVVRQSEDGRKAASSFTRIAKSTATDVRSSDTSSGDLKRQIASSAAKNVTADDAKNMGRAGISIARSEEGRKAASSIFNIARSSMNQVNQSQSQNPTARARPQRAPQQESSLGSLIGLMPPPKTPSQTVSKPPPSSSKPAPVPKFKISSEMVAAGASRSKPTIIRPGAEKPGSKPDSRSNSPETKRKAPPPRPSSGPQFKAKGTAPLRPNAPSSQTKGNIKPKRRAPLKPGGPDLLTSTQADSLPPRPGPGHPLYDKYMVSEPHGIALYDYKPIQTDELGFKANDVIILLQRIDADWLRGRCGNSEGLLPAAFLKIIKDLPKTDTKKTPSEPSAIAVFSFEGSAADELTFNEGDSIILLDRVGDQWYRGQCKGNTGIFPANHVRVVEDLPVKAVTTSISNVGSGPRCKAKFEYSSTNPDDLNFQPGDIIKLIENMGSQWLKGQLNGRTGIFPESFVDIIENLPTTNTKSTIAVNGSTGNKVTATFDFEGVESNELSFKAGDKITILNRVSQEWLHGELRSGIRGNLPSAFVDHIPANLPTLSTSQIGECIARFDFEPAGEGELALKVGDRVTLLEYIGDDWLHGSLGSKEGIFPKAFVEILGKGGSPSGGPTVGTCTARYDFYAEESDELTIVNGDVIEILEHISADWLVGRLNGKTGKFPKAFVDIR